jgi:hypothetical protein
MDKIMAYPIMTTPALVVDEAVKVAGRMPSKEKRCRTCGMAAGQLQDRPFPVAGTGAGEQQLDQRQVVAGLEALMERAERAQAGVDQDAAANFFRVAAAQATVTMAPSDMASTW